MTPTTDKPPPKNPTECERKHLAQWLTSPTHNPRQCKQHQPNPSADIECERSKYLDHFHFGH
jgi:hypothetical protein